MNPRQLVRPAGNTCPPARSEGRNLEEVEAERKRAAKTFWRRVESLRSDDPTPLRELIRSEQAYARITGRLGSH